MGRPVKGIVFDLDGTLIHSTIDFREMKRRIIEYFASRGADPEQLSPKETNVVILRKSEKTLREKGVPETEIGRIMGHVDSIMNEMEMEAVAETKAIKGAEETLKRLKELGYKTAILTRGHSDYAVEALRRVGLLHYFDLILGRRETSKPKPHQEALEHAAKRLGLNNKELILVGDHPIDSACAKNAKVRFIGVLTGSAKAETWRETGCGEVLKGIWELAEYLKRMEEMGR